MDQSNQPSVPPERQEPLYLALAGELISVLPESWKSASMEVVVEKAPDGSEALAHVIRNPEGLKGPVMPSDRLGHTTLALLQLFREYGRVWTALHFEVRERSDGDWDFSFEYTYG